MRHRWRSWRQAVHAVLVAGVMLALLTGVKGAEAATPSQPAAITAAGPSASTSTDLTVAGVGATDGYRLYVARPAGGWSWRALAVLAPGGADGETWVGQQCLTGDGRTVVAVVAPWDTVNTSAGDDRGGTAIAVDVATGAARVLATGVSLYYFDPGCGTGSQVTLTGFAGSDQRLTHVLRIDAATGEDLENRTVGAEITSALPVGGSIVAAQGSRLVRLTARGLTTLATLPSVGYDLRANSVGGVDLLTSSGTGTTTAWRWSGGAARRLASGRNGSMALAGAAAGRTVLTGAPASVVTGLSARPQVTGAVEGVSLGGDIEMIAAKGTGNSTTVLPALRDSAGRLVRAATVAPADTSAPVITATRPVSAAADTSVPACAVPRDNLQAQVPQPSNGQVNWAVENAVVNTLPARASGFDNLPGGGYQPEADFPQQSLLGTDTSGAHVPELVVDAILAQESNWDQASWHAPVGMPGDPLISDYYGNGDDPTQPISYAGSDCGYGIGQITPIMFAGKDSQDVQDRVAVDYAENIAASVQILSATWNQLYEDGITVNGDNPNWLEDWYATIWAYNSGVEPTTSALGLPSGCAQASPSCTDGAGDWGLGWANNPINPVYPPDRDVFLEDSYADASHPSDWPYQERVFGWMATPLVRSENGTAYLAYAPAPQYLTQPAIGTFCSTSVNNCDPTDPSGQYCQYQAAGPYQYHCWWNAPVTFADGCATACTAADMSENPSPAEPTAADPEPATCDLDTSMVPAGTGAGPTVVVTEEDLTAQDPADADINLAGCPSNPGNWVADGTFSMTNVWDSAGNPEQGQVDLHQLGAGFGGHMFFTHPVDSTDTADTVTGTWTPNLNAGGDGDGVYDIWVYVPDIGASAAAQYTITTGYAGTSDVQAIDQNDESGWVELGDYYLQPGASVTLSNAADSDSTDDLAFNAVAFEKVAGPDGWVAMGDSYAAGVGAPPYSTASQDSGCNRSVSSSYAGLTTQATTTFANDFALVACSGAQTGTLGGGTAAGSGSGSSSSSPGRTFPDQYAALSPQTRLVTVTIGGNDVGFGPILQDCLLSRLTPSKCINDYPNLNAQIEAMQGPLISVLGEIAARSPSATIVVVDYPQIFADQRAGCYLTSNVVTWINANWDSFDSVMAEAAENAGLGSRVRFLDEQEVLAPDHQLCGPGTSYVNPLVVPSVTESFHPNANGYALEGQDLSTLLTSLGY